MRQLYLIVGVALCCWATLAARTHAGEHIPAQLAAKIDAHLAAEWDKAGATPAAIVDDATYLRRLSLDLVGRIPTVYETQTFLDDSRADKRARLAHQLIESGGHARHFATFWRRTWAPQTDTPEYAGLTEALESWASVQLRDNRPYDEMVRGLLTARRSRSTSGGEGVDPIGFMAASQFKSDSLAANTTRAFLGINLDCAQCHDHPFARWSRDEFWQTAAFFEAPKRAETDVALQITIPDTQRTVAPATLDKREIHWPSEINDDTGRTLLAAWITADDNPFFARNTVNRLWAQLFGLGLIEPLDDVSDDNPSTHPALLNELTAAFVASDYDLKYLTQAMVLTKAYQLATVVEPGSAAEEPQLFARMQVRGLSGEQLYDSFRVAAGLPAKRRDLLGQRKDRLRERFVAQFTSERAASAERSIVQSLSLMNGELTRELTTIETSPLLKAATEAPFLNAQAKVDTLFLATVNRPPTPQESSRLVNYLESGQDERAPAQLLADIFWTLLNSSEFNTNH